MELKGKERGAVTGGSRSECFCSFVQKTKSFENQ